MNLFKGNHRALYWTLKLIGLAIWLALLGVIEKDILSVFLRHVCSRCAVLSIFMSTSLRRIRCTQPFLLVYRLMISLSTLVGSVRPAFHRELSSSLRLFSVLSYHLVFWIILCWAIKDWLNWICIGSCAASRFDPNSNSSVEFHSKLMVSFEIFLDWPHHLVPDTVIPLTVLKPLPHLNVYFLPARRYASAGYRDRNVSVCPSVCHAPVLCQNEESYRHDFFTIW